MNTKEKVINVDGSLTEEDALYLNEEVQPPSHRHLSLETLSCYIVVDHNLLAISLQSNRSAQKSKRSRQCWLQVDIVLLM